MKQKNQLLLLMACLATISSCQTEPSGTTSESYKTMTVQKEKRTLFSTYSATIRGQQDIDIYPQISGTLKNLFVKEGQRVSKGQTLFVIDQVSYVAALNTAKANAKAARAALATARLNEHSQQELFMQGVVSEFDVQTAGNERLRAEAALEQAEAQRVNAENDLSYTVVKSPADGVIGMLPYRQGTLVGPTMPQPLTTVSDNSSMYVYFSMNETQLLGLVRNYGSPEDAISQMPGIRLVLSDGSEYGSEGRIESISGIVERATGSVSLRAIFPNPEHLLFSGSSGNVSIPTDYSDCVVVPQEATFRIQDKTLVYKVTDGIARSAAIDVSPINDGREYIVLSGLNAGEKIVSAGAGLVREETVVETKR